ncbi:MAG: hypothetical protein NVSMB19_08980 [Vulcanimicrobiaceae bacterium]
MLNDFNAHKTIEEVAERHEHATHGSGGPTLHARLVPIAAALLAVIAAIATMLANKAATEALTLKNEAILLRTEASDSYNFYQARSIKEHVYRAAADANPALGGPARAKLLGISRHEKSEKGPLLEVARKQEEEAKQASHRSERVMRAHEVMESGVTMLEVAIAVVSISALTSSTFLVGFGAVAAVGGLIAVLYGLTLR